MMLAELVYYQLMLGLLGFCLDPFPSYKSVMAKGIKLPLKLVFGQAAVLLGALVLCHEDHRYSGSLCLVASLLLIK